MDKMKNQWLVKAQQQKSKFWGFEELVDAICSGDYMINVIGSVDTRYKRVEMISQAGTYWIFKEPDEKPMVADK